MAHLSPLKLKVTFDPFSHEVSEPNGDESRFHH
jgi:hypothetical protein